MLGMLSRDSGTVTWNGKPLDINTCNVGYLAEERGLYPKYTIMDQLMYLPPCAVYQLLKQKANPLLGRAL